MAFPPNQGTPLGDRKSLLRGAWADQTSNHRGLITGRGFYGNDKFNYDDAEGHAPRITFYGATETIPFRDISYANSGDTELKYKNYSSGLTSLRRKSENSPSSTTSTAGRVIQMTNGRTSGEVISTNYNNIESPAYEGLITKTPPDGTWYCSYWARKSDSSPSSTNNVRAALFIFGVKYVSGQYIYSFSGQSGGNGAGGYDGTPATGKSYYYSQNYLSTTWTKYEMFFQFDASKGVEYITMRIDNDYGYYNIHTGGSIIYIDRLTLHPVNIKLQASNGDAGPNPDNLNNFDFSTYAT
jgi:hypothetical protein